MPTCWAATSAAAATPCASSCCARPGAPTEPRSPASISVPLPPRPAAAFTDFVVRMPRGKLCVSWALLLLFAAALAAQQPVPFQILTTHLPPPQAGQRYEVQLEATGGQPP